MTGRPLTLIRSPLDLGLRPLRPGHMPGAGRAPEALRRAGLDDALRPHRVVDLPRPARGAEPELGTRLREGPAIRAFNLRLAEEVEAVLRGGGFAFVLGGDCSVLLGALAGARRGGPLGLVHLDGHSDFRHDGNEDLSRRPGAVAGMDLALATGRGDPLLTDWPGAPAPLVPDARVVQVGEREARRPDYPWRDIAGTAITRIEVFEARAIGPDAVLRRALPVLGGAFWVHWDVDVLDQAVMPAVDSPGSPGIEPADLAAILRGLLAQPGCLGMTLTIYDPDLDPDGRCAATILSLVAEVFVPKASAG